MKRFLIAILFGLFLCHGYGPCQTTSHAWMGALGMSGGVGTSGSACTADIFSDNFNRTDSSSIGGDWTETDTGGLLSIASNKLLLTHTSATLANGYKAFATEYSEVWYEFKLILNDVTAVSAAYGSSYVAGTAYTTSTTDVTYRVFLNMDSAGDVQTLGVRYLNNSDGWANIASDALAWTADTEYTIRVHTKRSTGVGTDDGIIEVWRNGTLVANASNCANYTYGQVGRLYVGTLYDEFTSTTLTIKWDDVRFRNASFSSECVNCTADTDIYVDDGSHDHKTFSTASSNAPGSDYGFISGPFTFPCTGKLKTGYVYQSGTTGSQTARIGIFKDLGTSGTIDTADVKIGVSDAITSSTSSAWRSASFAGTETVTKGDHFYIVTEAVGSDWDFGKNSDAVAGTNYYWGNTGYNDANLGDHSWGTAGTAMLNYITIQAPSSCTDTLKYNYTTTGNYEYLGDSSSTVCEMSPFSSTATAAITKVGVNISKNWAWSSTSITAVTLYLWSDTGGHASGTVLAQTAAIPVGSISDGWLEASLTASYTPSSGVTYWVGACTTGTDGGSFYRLTSGSGDGNTDSATGPTAVSSDNDANTSNYRIYDCE